jgi:hypothetical protein
VSNDDKHDDAIPSASEKARAEAFGKLVDRLVEGDPLPPAMDLEDRALIEMATMVVAGTHEMELAPERRSSIIDAALERAVLGSTAKTTAGPKKPGDKQPAEAAIVDLLARRESRAGRVVPWAVAAVAVAAAIVLFITRPASESSVARGDDRPADLLELSSIHRSRSADPLVGQIPKSQSGHASERLDTIYSDRLAGYRDLSFRRRLRGGNL